MLRNQLSVRTDSVECDTNNLDRHHTNKDTALFCITCGHSMSGWKDNVRCVNCGHRESR